MATNLLLYAFRSPSTFLRIFRCTFFSSYLWPFSQYLPSTMGTPAPRPLLVISANKVFEQRASEMNVSHPRGIGKERRDPIYAQLWQICWSRGRR